MSEPQKPAWKVRREQRIAEGLCTKCGKPNDTNTRMCSTCREIINRQAGECRAYKKNRGICQDCGAEIFPGETYCRVCMNRRNDMNRKRYQKDPNRMIEAQKRRKERYKEEGRCIYCGNPLSDADKSSGLSSCLECRLKMKKYKLEHRTIKPIGICRYCDKPAVPGKCFCPEHLQTVRERAENARSHIKQSGFEKTKEIYWTPAKRKENENE